ncbi:hypothetical protein J2T38_002264 [Neisseria perflava]|uniref:hypothetical protein n=1 Tax=Neisseria perflava TaxID=33053 RepID=UPI0020A08448|nr:hypothetical protein [Neisseria perflava]MCP1773415.1 hypothetical protein [Neisseria perflava]
MENDTAQMDGSYEYAQAGLVCYELGEYDEAYRYFDEAYRRGAYRGAFQEYDKKYGAVLDN